MMLLVDVGNTRIKWANYAALALQVQPAQAHAGWSLGDVQRHITGSMPPPERVLVSNVAGPAIAELLSQAMLQAWGVRPVFVQSSASAAGVRNAYAEPAKLGVDRWLGMIAGHQMKAGALCVVSVGTAMTIDGIDSEGHHLGGLITPGPQLMVTALLGGTSEIAGRVGELRATDALLNADTANAIHNGARHALAALIERAAQRICQQTGAEPSVILTGGASGLIDTLLTMPFQQVPELVLRGLAVLGSGK